MSHVEESGAGSDGGRCLRLLQGMLKRCCQEGGWQQRRGINENIPGSAATSAPGTPAVACLHGDTPGVPRGAIGAAPRPLRCRGDPVPA